MVKEFVQVKNNPHVSEAKRLYFVYLGQIDINTSNSLTVFCLAQSCVFHVYGQSHDTDEIHRNARRGHVCR